MEYLDLNKRRRLQLLAVRGLFLASFSLLAFWLAGRGGNPPVTRIGVLLACWIVASLPLVPIRRFSRLRANALSHLLLDSWMLAALLYLTGGYANPLVSLFLFPVLIGGLTLPPRQAWLVGGLIICAYTLLIPFHQPLPLMHDMARGFHLHLIGMWLTFVMTVLMLLTVVVRMSEERRLHEAQLATLRQNAMRDRNMLSLGAQAASDAHELGTPVNALMLLLDQWDSEAERLTSEQRDRIDQMKKQLARCRNVLSRLAERANALCAAETAPESAPAMTSQAVKQWRNLHPDLSVDIEIKGPQCSAPAGLLLEQAIFILLDNALEAGARHACVRLDTQKGFLRLDVKDDGPGFPSQVLEGKARSPLSDKNGGKGLGLYLLRYLTEHAGGVFAMENPTGGGARISLIFKEGAS